jgi:hypothetical protein
MQKSQYKDYMKKKFPLLAEAETISDVVIPVTAAEIHEEVKDMESFGEHQRDEKSAAEALTSDEI